MSALQKRHCLIDLILLVSISVASGVFRDSHAASEAFLFKVDGTVLKADGSKGENGLHVVVQNIANPRRVQTDTTGNLAGDGKYVITFFDPNIPIARTGDIFEVSVIDKAGNLLGQNKQSITATDLAAFGTSIDVELKLTPVRQIVANLFSINGTVYTAEGAPVEDGFTVTVHNAKKPSLMATTTTGAVAGDGGYVVTFFDPFNPVAEAGDVLAITILDKASNPFTQKEHTLTEADVKAFGAIIDITRPMATAPIPADVNGDGAVNIFDLVEVASQFGQSGENLSADVNGDGTVNIFDLVAIASNFGRSVAE